LIANSIPNPASPRRKGWADLVVKVCLVVAVGGILAHYVLPRYFNRLALTDRERGLARPKLEPKPRTGSTPADAHRSTPCLFLSPPGAACRASSSATLADCMTLVPDGKKRDVLELNLGSGELFPVKTDLYVPDSMPFACTRT
jgi:hypothetical protein